MLKRAVGRCRGAAAGFKVGDRVVYYTLGGYTEVAQVPVTKIAKVGRCSFVAFALVVA